MKYLALCLLVIVSALAVLAHGDEEHDDDDVKAVEIGEVAVPENPSYHEHVRPIMEASCNTCHSAGQIAAYAPFENPKMSFGRRKTFASMCERHYAALDALARESSAKA